MDFDPFEIPIKRPVEAIQPSNPMAPKELTQWDFFKTAIYEARPVVIFTGLYNVGHHQKIDPRSRSMARN
jgi:hypothetical protein